MLSEKKSFIAQQEIDFLGMHISHGTYSPGPHIAHELLKFPDSQLSREQIQQFLGTVNYIRDFIPLAAQYISPLSSLLKKTPPPWGPEHTQAPPSLYIPSDGLRILQTDIHCAHASGSFKPSQQHYHTIYKEILAVRYGIEKFDFYLRGHTFKVEMDNSSFPHILDFKNKVPPNPLLLRLKSWFERYDFHTSHIKGSQNIIPDMLSRPKHIQLISTSSIILVIYTLSPKMAEPSYEPSYILNLPAKQLLSFPPKFTQQPVPSHQPTSLEVIQFASDHLYHYFHFLYNEDDHHHITRPNKLFITPFHLRPYHFSQNTLWYLWCLSVLYLHPVVIPFMKTSQHLHDPTNENSLLWTFLQWFYPLSWWRNKIVSIMGFHNIWKMDDYMSNKLSCIFIFYRLYLSNPNTKLLWSLNHAYKYQTVYDLDTQWPQIKVSLINFLYELNHVDPDYPDEVFIIPSTHSPPRYFQDSQDPMDLDTDFDPADALHCSQPYHNPDIGPSRPWYKSFYDDIDSSDPEYDNNNLSPSQNSM
ncbi:hypothetical protein ACOSQ2_023620 [Xanthoceras sorbifolium]